MSSLKKKEASKQKQKAWSTSSFYHQPSFKLLNTPQSPSPLIDDAMIQQKCFEDSAHLLYSTIILQKDQISQASSQAQSSIASSEDNLNALESSSNGELKKIYKQDLSKPWIRQLEKSVHETMTSCTKNKIVSDEKGFEHLKKVGLGIQKIQTQIREEKKERERCWEQAIDELGGNIMSFEEIIGEDSENSQIKLDGLENQLQEMQQILNERIETEKKKRADQSAHIVSLIENVMGKLLI